MIFTVYQSNIYLNIFLLLSTSFFILHTILQEDDSLIEAFNKLWHHSGQLIQHYWSKLYNMFNDEFQLVFIGTTALYILSFCFFNMFFLLIDYVQPKWALQYKVQDNRKITREEFIKALKRVLLNLVFFTPVTSFLVYKLGVWRRCSFNERLPNFWEVIIHLIACGFINETLYYYFHRLMHHPRLYKYCHKIHHEFTAPTSITSIYAHPLEHFIGNNSITMIAPLICGSHIFVAWLWLIMVIFIVTISHCGYHFPLLPSPEHHDYHHYSFDQFYGSFGILDWLHGTDGRFRKSTAFKRHFISLSLVPVKQMTNEKVE